LPAGTLGRICRAHEQFNVPHWHESDKRLGQSKRYPAPHAIYSLDLSLCDLWLFELLKHWMTDRQLQSPEEILDEVTKRWDEITFEELQNIFLGWMERLQWVIQNGGEYFIN
jgi:hypothetical protein